MSEGTGVVNLSDTSVGVGYWINKNELIVEVC